MKCLHCHREKPAEEFQRDSRKPTGRRGACKVCTNEKRKLTRGKIVEVQAKPITENVFQSLSKKYGSHFVISVRKDGIYNLQIHQNPCLHFKGSAYQVQEAIEKALHS